MNKLFSNLINKDKNISKNSNQKSVTLIIFGIIISIFSLIFLIYLIKNKFGWIKYFHNYLNIIYELYLNKITKTMAFKEGGMASGLLIIAASIIFAAGIGFIVLHFVPGTPF